MDSRELTRSERVGIRKLVVGMCANYDRDYGCLPLDCECYMLNKWWTGACCKYFQNAVLPLNPAQEAAILGRSAPDTCTCSVCGEPFIQQASGPIVRQLARVRPTAAKPVSGCVKNAGTRRSVMFDLPSKKPCVYAASQGVS